MNIGTWKVVDDYGNNLIRIFFVFHKKIDAVYVSEIQIGMRMDFPLWRDSQGKSWDFSQLYTKKEGQAFLSTSNSNSHKAWNIVQYI